MTVRFAPGVLAGIDARIRAAWDGDELAFPLYGLEDGRELRVADVGRMGFVPDADRGEHSITPPADAWEASSTITRRLVGSVHTHPRGGGIAPSEGDLAYWRAHRARLGLREYVGIIAGRDTIAGHLTTRAWTVTSSGVAPLQLFPKGY